MIFEETKDNTQIENTYRYNTNESLAKYALENGGSIYPLIIPGELTGSTGLMNPSILNVDGKIIINIRHVNYTFYHSEKKLFQHPWGPLTYLHPENDQHLRTWNWYVELDDQYRITRYNKIDTDKFDTYEPKWDFVGLEDARLINWNNKIYISGVRRDTTTNGQGRMELSEIVIEKDSVKEISRFRIPTPNNIDSYCEKNWMPVLDLPYHYVKWSNPTEVVKVDPITQTCTTVFVDDTRLFSVDPRGGTQIVKYGDYYIALTHEVDLFKSTVGRKDAVYRHRFIVWDKDWKVVSYSNSHSLMNGHVEFAVGMCFQGTDVLITFGFQDNAAYLLKIPFEKMIDFINDN